jgi:hypothetical protein
MIIYSMIALVAVFHRWIKEYGDNSPLPGRNRKMEYKISWLLKHSYESGIKYHN